ncbi:hypothetical protein GLW08_20340 [Pontibacillus yanchengensis]|uniref:Uncharacterized protein n=2 Tax=Pontibacillus yanchengensis TaxID=462910 RepID=A0ACC7VLP9_9BACI|nr:hypothetical protein [Pontibacillus yanchengensis]MYL35455.1 hypothetical protein [Pontibacillus yanchengensis]MYL55655.1 hypothetical protein [Pontibacillus yanchengensis]
MIIKISSTFKKYLALRKEFNTVEKALKQATHEGDVAWSEELMEERYRITCEMDELLPARV